MSAGKTYTVGDGEMLLKLEACERGELCFGRAGFAIERGHDRDTLGRVGGGVRSLRKRFDASGM